MNMVTIRPATVVPTGSKFLHLPTGKTLNAGEAVEAMVAEYFRVEYRRDNVSFDTGSDLRVGDRNISVKSPRATLAHGLKGDKADQIHDYFTRSHSNEWVFGVWDKHDQTVALFFMGWSEFYDFLKSDCWKVDSSSGKLRQTGVSGMAAEQYLRYAVCRSRQ